MKSLLYIIFSLLIVSCESELKFDMNNYSCSEEASKKVIDEVNTCMSSYRLTAHFCLKKNITKYCTEASE